MKRLMDEYRTFYDYVITQDTYEDVMKRVNSKQVHDDDDDFDVPISMISVKRKSPFVIPPFPKGWEEIFQANIHKIEHSLEYVNEQIIKNGCTVFPNNSDLFNAFRVPPKRVKVIIIGQDPYYTRDRVSGNPVSNGMAFSCVGSSIQPSLRNIFKEIRRTHGSEPESGNLEFWANQGVLLLNTCLTVNEGKAASHGSAWLPVMISILDGFFEAGFGGIICLWGVKAKDFFKKVTFNSNRVEILEAGHPSSTNTSNPFYGCGHFKRIDEIFEEYGKRPINWISPP